VRLEAAKALANVPDERAIAPLIKRLDNAEESVDVRIAAADALRNFRTPLAAQALVRVLRDRDFAVSWQARKGLKLMTGRDYRYDQAAWLTYLSEEAPFG
jgi:HEAT repeat protein